MLISKTEHFKECHKRFINALDYMNKNYDRLIKDPVKYEKVKKNFIDRFEKPLDEAWLALLPEDRETLKPLYLLRKAQTDPEVKKIIDVMGGELINFNEKENDDPPF